MRRRFALAAGPAIAVLLLSAHLCTAQMPLQMNYQVMLTDDADEPLADQSLQLVFRLFEQESGGGAVWDETHNVTTNGIGVASVVLGSTSPLDVLFLVPMWLQVEVDGQVMEPRRPLTPAPYAHFARVAEHAVNSDHLGAIVAESYALDEDLWAVGVLNDPSNPLEWSKLKNVPDGFADGIDDTGVGIGGSGTSEYVPVFTGPTSLGNSVIRDEGGRVCIGGSGYDARLAVEWNGPSPALYVTNTSALESPALANLYRHEPMTGVDDGMLLLQYQEDSTDGSLIECMALDGVYTTTVFSVDHDGLVSSSGGLLLTAPEDRLHTLEVHGDIASASAKVISATYEGTGTNDAVGVYGESAPADYWGYGGLFKGGFIGASGEVEPTGTGSYYGLNGYCSGGSGTNCGVSGVAVGTGTNYGVYGTCSVGGSSWAGYFAGDARVTGTFFNPGPVLEIDHPSDPEDSYLRHALVASSEMKTVYDGTVLLDSAGEATVELPDWFEDLNGDFRYQLTCIGSHAPVYVADEVEGGSFRIAGGEPGMKVSWQVTGVRHDAGARSNPLVVEEEKNPKDRGRYLSPQAYRAPNEAGIGHFDDRKKDG